MLAVVRIAVIAFAALVPTLWAQSPCAGSTLTGTVRDNTQALIPGAVVVLDGNLRQSSGADGRFQFGCVAPGRHRLSVRAEGFAAAERRFDEPAAAELQVMLHAATDVEVEVNGDADAPPAGAGVGASAVISGKGLQTLADDPDDLLRELQQLAGTAGGNPANATIAVDGFQDSTALPPKSSIAYIKVNPDLFSSEYSNPPFEGGRIEVYTKPGQKTYHGALFTTNGSPWENARDPFSVSKAALGKQRYGFEFSGPVLKRGSDFALNLEYRRIDNFAVVNAVTLNATGSPVNTVANVAAPQRLWLGAARTGWQLGPKNTFTVGLTTSQNSLQNLGVGGTALAEAGYNASQYDNTVRFSNVTTASAKLMHETRLSLRWDGEDDSPNSSAPQVMVAGAFTGGGATLGAQQLHELRLEFDDDAVWLIGKHTLKIGTQFFFNEEHDRVTTNFNGTYVFGGGVGVTGIQQYGLALAGLPGGTPTAYTGVAGDPALHYTTANDALFIQDDWNLPHGFHLSGGVRYYVQNAPTVVDGATPRLGVAWSPGKKRRWSLNAHAGIFTDNVGPKTYRELLREDGTARVTSTVYNPVYGNPFSAGAVPIHSIRTQGQLSNTLWGAEAIGGSYSLPKGWNVSANLAWARIWNGMRSLNVNSPLNGSPTGPRLGAANLNVLQMQNSGQGKAQLEMLMVEQHSLKRLQFMVGAIHILQSDDTDDNPFFSPQSSKSDAGEFARRSNGGPWQIMGNGTATLPYKVQWSVDFHATGDAAYNITTGFDNNGDGNFNDRPQYASASTPGAVSTQWGWLVASGGTGVFPRNKGTMPWTIHLDTNLQRSFKLTKNAKAAHPQALTFNVRSSNVLNHTNVTSVGGVLGSPLFGVPYAADNGRRVEAGARYSF
jgi:hypothetical protein